MAMEDQSGSNMNTTTKALFLKQVHTVLIVAIMIVAMVPVVVNAATVSSVKNLHAVNPKEGSIRLTWNTVKGCRYEIEAKCDGEIYKKGTYKVKKNQYTFTKVPHGHKYSFKVRAVKSGKYSKKKTVSIRLYITPKTPKITGKSPGYRRNDISWKLVKDATALIIKETDLETGKAKDTKLEGDVTAVSYYSKIAGKKYKYSVRAYTDDHGKRMYSDWSNEVTVTPKKTRIGQASKDYDGKAGDGNGKEVASANWAYSSSDTSYRNWTYVFRLKDTAKADAAADMLEKAIANDNIGYCSQGNKVYGENACQKLAAKVGYDLSKITIKTGCSCGDIVTLCIKSTGIECPYTGSGLDVAKALKDRSNNFLCFTEEKYVADDAYLQRGDILVTAHSNGKNNHVCMVL